MSFNKIILIGNLGRDPELRYTPQGDAVCDFSIAVNDRKRDKAGEFHDVTTWFKVTLWRRQAENASKYLTKGSSVYVEGRLQVEEWTDRDGNKRFTLAVQGSEIQFVGGNRGDAMTQDTASENNYTNTNDLSAGDNIALSPNDDDIPF